MKSVNPPNSAQVLAELKRDIMVGLNAVQIGIIEAFNADRQTATVRIALKQVKSIQPDGTRELVEHPLLLECPCVMLYGGPAYMTFPIAPGDNCIVLFNDREIDEWFANGGVQTPQTGRVHDISDGLVLVGLRSLQSVISGYLQSGIRLSNQGARIDVLPDVLDSIASLWTHQGDIEITGNVEIDGNLSILGDTYGNGSGDLNLRANLRQENGKVMEAGNGATGTFNTVQVIKGIVVGGS